MVDSRCKGVKSRDRRAKRPTDREARKVYWSISNRIFSVGLIRKDCWYYCVAVTYWISWASFFYYWMRLYSKNTIRIIKLSFQLYPIRDHLGWQEIYEAAYRVLLGWSWSGLMLSDAWFYDFAFGGYDLLGLSHFVYLLFLKELRLSFSLWLHHFFKLLYFLGEHFDFWYIFQEITLKRDCLSIFSQFGLMLRNFSLQVIFNWLFLFIRFCIIPSFVILVGDFFLERALNGGRLMSSC